MTVTPVAWLHGYERDWLRADIVGGIAAGLVVIPQAMAYATIAGLPTQVGLYTCIVPMVAYALLGGSRTMSVSTTSTIATLSGITLVSTGVALTGDAIRNELATLTLLVGLTLLVARVVRLGPLVDNVSEALVIGLKVGVGLTVAAGQLPKVLGIPADPDADTFVTSMRYALSHLSDANGATVLLSAGTIAGLYALSARVPQVPAPLVAVAAGIGLTVLADLPDHGVALIAPVPSGLPAPVAPSTSHVSVLLPGAIAIALMAYLETVSVARAVRRPEDPGIDSNGEMVANGAAAVAGAFFQAMPPAGGFSQTAVNQRAGSRTQASELVTVVLAVAAALFLGPVLDDLPEATLGSLVIVAVVGLIKPHEIAFLARFDRPELLVAGITAVVGLTAGLLQAVAVGVVANLLLLLHELNHPDVDELRLTRDGDLAPDGHTTVDGLLVLRIGAPLYTANARAAQARVLALVDAADPHPHVLILDATVAGRITTTVLAIMRELDTQLAERGITMWVSSLPPRALEQARLTPEWAAWTAAGRFHRTTAAAVAAYQAGAGARRVTSDESRLRIASERARAGKRPVSRGREGADAMSLPKIATRDEWLAARIELLAKEKELTRRRDALNVERRNLPMVEVDEGLRVRRPRRQGVAARPVRGPPAADHLPLHVRPRLGRGLPELHGGHRRAVATGSSTTSTPATRPTPWCRGPRWRSSSAWKAQAGLGRCPGTRRSAPTSTTTSASPSTSRSRRSSYNYRTKAEHEARWARSRASFGQPFEMPGRSCFLAGRRARVPHLLAVRPGAGVHRRVVLLPRPHRARAPGGLGGAQGPHRLGPQQPTRFRVVTRDFEHIGRRAEQRMGCGPTASARLRAQHVALAGRPEPVGRAPRPPRLGPARRPGTRSPSWGSTPCG